MSCATVWSHWHHKSKNEYCSQELISSRWPIVLHYYAEITDNWYGHKELYWNSRESAFWCCFELTTNRKGIYHRNMVLYVWKSSWNCSNSARQILTWILGSDSRSTYYYYIIIVQHSFGQHQRKSKRPLAYLLNARECWVPNILLPWLHFKWRNEHNDKPCEEM